MGQEDEEAGWVDVTEGHEEQEVFRFFSDGGASGALKFTLTYGKFSRTFSISPLTGRMLTEEKKEPPMPLTVDYVAECEKALSKQLGRKVNIVNGKRKGRFELEFYGQDDLQRLYEALLTLDSGK
jgi:hypothetical protein